MSEDFIHIKGIKVNNLKNIDIDIPRNKLVVITGLSGSGKSSLAFDTLYAEGQRRYIESLSSYARQFMGKISKPELESIKGIPPAIAIEQRVISRNPRSTVGTTTEIYEYLKLLFSRVGRTYSPISEKEVKRESLKDVIKYVQDIPDGSRVHVLSPIQIVSERTVQEQLEILKQQGFSRFLFKDEFWNIEDLLQYKKKIKVSDIFLSIDRFKSERIADNHARFCDSVQTAFKEGKGECVLRIENESVTTRHFSNLYELDGISFIEPTANLFSFNNPFGACPTCKGTGMIEGVDPDLVFPDRSLSLFDGAVACWRGDKLSEWKDFFIRRATKKGFPPHRAIENLSEEEYNLLWNGDDIAGIEGIKQFFEYVERNLYKIQYRVLFARYRGHTLCHDCHGSRLRKEALYVKIKGHSIADLSSWPISKLLPFFKQLTFSNPNDNEIAKPILRELINRLGFLNEVGLSYLSLNRLSKTLSGGESQRINLATSLGSSLVGSLYILDEPSIGLHTRDTQNLIRVLKHLRDIGNTVVVVEHDEEIMRSADYIIDIGPEAGRLGGEVVFQGTFDELLKDPKSLTAAYLRGMVHPPMPNPMSIEVPSRRRRWRNYVEIKGAKEHNLKDIDVKIPLEVMTVVTGVSGSGKSSLIKNILYNGLQKILHETGEKVGRHQSIDADFNKLTDCIMVDQNPIGRSTRSNPATYIKAYDDIRELYASQPLAKQRGYKAGFFSFNVPGGRCEACEGEGVIHIGMQFMADVDLVCKECNGSRFKDEVLDIKVNGNTIGDILNMTINQAIEFFSQNKTDKLYANITEKLKPLQDVGLGYLKLGQSSSTLSGGEAQRIKLAYYLSLNNSKNNTLFIFDEPTTGLHFHDISKLYKALNMLIEKGNSIVVIEHNPEIIKCADWIIDLGPEGGDDGGKIVCQGTPEEIIKHKKSYTGKYLIGKV